MRICRRAQYPRRPCSAITTTGYPDHLAGRAVSLRVRSACIDVGGNVAEWVHDIYGVYSNSQAKGIEYRPCRTARRAVSCHSWIRAGGTASISELRFAYRDFGNRGPARRRLSHRAIRRGPGMREMAMKYLKFATLLISCRCSGLSGCIAAQQESVRPIGSPTEWRRSSPANSRRPSSKSSARKSSMRRLEQGGESASARRGNVKEFIRHEAAGGRFAVGAPVRHSSF